MVNDGWGLCRIMLAILDATSSIVCVGHLVSESFKDVLGVREGAVESPNAFNMYVHDLRDFLESKHPHPCKLMGFLVAIILYADDAAIPADSVEDLQLAAKIFEEFCNSHHLYIATSKTFVTVFHNVSDQGVRYDGNAVYVDGSKVALNIYSTTIAAAASFKYLGVTLDHTCSHNAHAGARFASQDRAANLLISGLSRVPGYSHCFMMYLWSSLVAPVVSYGMEVFPLARPLVDTARSKERKWWRRLLKVGGRFPNATAFTFMGCDYSDISWRVQRCTLFLKLAN